MAQRLWIELDRLNHQVYIQISTTSQEMEDAVQFYIPDIIIAPFLKSKIPSVIFEKYVCLIVHPGIIGDRGASSLDWAILRNKKRWGVTILQAVEKMDSGPVWSFQEFEMRNVSKGQLYRNEVAQAASRGILEALTKFEKDSKPEPADEFRLTERGHWNNKITQKDLSFRWTDKSKDILCKINAADSDPGVLVSLNGNTFFCYGAHIESELVGSPGDILAQKDEAICVASQDSAIWLTQFKSVQKGAIKLPAILSLGKDGENIPQPSKSLFDKDVRTTWQEIQFIKKNVVGYLHFDFYNGAMSTKQCIRLKEAFIEIKKTDVKIIVLMGGEDLWSNGIHLNIIENSANSADESWNNINAIDDLILEIINSTDHYIISALHGNAGAGGVSLALAADKVIARNGIVINPHTKNMGLYGSEYWTYLLPKRIGVEKANRFTQDCLPWGVQVSKEIGLIDDFYGETNAEFRDFADSQAQKIASLSYFDKLIKAKKYQRQKDHQIKTLEAYRKEELEKMHANFYEDNLGFENKRHCFVYKIPTAELQEDLYSSRRKIYRKRKWEAIKYTSEPEKFSK